jgi:hypothetical protein
MKKARNVRELNSTQRRRSGGFVRVVESGQAHDHGGQKPKGSATKKGIFNRRYFTDFCNNYVSFEPKHQFANG